MIQRTFHTPEGVRDVYSAECEKKHYLRSRINKVIHAYGYRDIETPTFEYFDVFGRETGTIPSKDLYKFFDREGNTLVLRPDFTPSVARAAAKYFLDDGRPVRLCYVGSTFVNSSSYQGRLKESTEVGVELMGDGSVDADAELIALSVELLKTTGLTDFQISVGQLDYFKALIEESGLSDEAVDELRALVAQKNYFGVDELLIRENMADSLREVFHRLPQLFGGVSVLAEAKRMATNPRAVEAIERLEEICEILKLYGVENYVTFDLGMLSKYRYYTGIIFRGYTYGTGEALIKGGRYDELMNYFSRPAPAIGFSLVMEQVMNALSRQNVPVPYCHKKVLILYPEHLRAAAVRMAQEKRSQGEEVICSVKKEEGEITSAAQCGADLVLLLLSETEVRMIR